MRRRIRAAVAAAVVVLAGGLTGVGVQAATASAASTPQPVEITATTSAIAAAGGSVTFYADGDRLVVCDTAGDGYGALAELHWADYTGRRNRADGNGDCSTATGNIPEGTPVAARVCLIRAGSVSNCSEWVYGNA